MDVWNSLMETICGCTYQDIEREFTFKSNSDSQTSLARNNYSVYSVFSIQPQATRWEKTATLCKYDCYWLQSESSFDDISSSMSCEPAGICRICGESDTAVKSLEIKDIWFPQFCCVAFLINIKSTQASAVENYRLINTLHPIVD